MHTATLLRAFTLPLFVGALLACHSDATAPAPPSAQLDLLPTLGGQFAYASTISANGEIVIGVSRDEQSRERAFRWTRMAGVEDIGTLGGGDAIANGISPDGYMIVGTSRLADGRWQAFRWRTGVMEPLGTLGGIYSEALGATSSGVIVGVASRATGGLGAFRWTDFGGMEELGTSGLNAAIAISADGSVIAGSSELTIALLAFQWTAGTGLVHLTTPNLWLLSEATAVSASGKVIAGWASPPQGGRRAVRWVDGVMSELGTLEARVEQATAISPDGDVVVGMSGFSNGVYSAFRWTPAHGMENLNEVFADIIHEDWMLASAYAVSSRGDVIAGMARSRIAPNVYRAFVLQTGGR